MSLSFFFLIFFIFSIFSSDFFRKEGDTIFLDFRTAWAASSIGLSGNPSLAYSPDVINRFVWSEMPPYLNQSDISEANISDHQQLFWLYPPTFFFAILYFSLIPFLLACISYMSLTLLAFFSLLRFILPKGGILFCFAALPAVWSNLNLGQHGFLLASLAGWGAVNINRHPALAGVLIGFLCIKPHLALIFPIALAAVGAWRVMFIALIAAIMLTGLSLLTLGLDIFPAWFSSLSFARNILEFDAWRWSFSPSTFALSRLLGASMNVSYFLQFIIACSTILFIWRFWRDAKDGDMKCAALLTATLMASPYIYDYDLIVLSIPMALIIKSAIRTRWLPFEKELLLLVGLLPLSMIIIAIFTSIQIGPIVMVILLWDIYRRQAFLKEASLWRSL